MWQSTEGAALAASIVTRLLCSIPLQRYPDGRASNTKSYAASGETPALPATAFLFRYAPRNAGQSILPTAPPGIHPVG